MEEIFEDIEGYEGLYQVSNLGRVKSLTRKDSLGRNLLGRILVPQKHYDGYFYVGLLKNGKVKHRSVHGLVAHTFIKCVDNTLEINHIDGDKSNNCADNLEWVTHQENMAHAVRIGLTRNFSGENNPQAKFTKEDAEWIRANYIPYDKDFGTRALARKFGVSNSRISDLINGKTWNN